MKVYSLKQNMGKININEHILPIFLINLINILAKKKKNTKKLITTIFWKPYVWFPSNKIYID